jgi:hypothetical protein
MARAAYQTGLARPELHRELGNYWTIRSKMLPPDGTEWASAWAMARWHYRKAVDIESDRRKKRLRATIHDFVRQHYPDTQFSIETPEE